MRSIAAIALLVMGTSVAQAQSGTSRFELAQATTPSDSAHTLFRPNAPDPGRIGQVKQLPQGGVGVTTGGTSSYQTMGTPNGGSSVAVPNSNGTSSVIGSGGRAGTASTLH